MASELHPPPTPTASTTASTIELVAQCLCKANTFTTKVPPSSSPGSPLPLTATYCHCTSCRHNTGAMYGVSVDWSGFNSKSSQEIEQAIAGLKRYHRSKTSTTLMFCEKCSSPMFFSMVISGQDGKVVYGTFPGVLRGYEVDSDGNRGVGVVEGLVTPTHHLFLGDTIDGGATCWLRGWNGESHGAKRWMGHWGRSEEIEVGRDWPDIGKLSEGVEYGNEGEEVGIRCHCGGVDFVLRAGEARREFCKKSENREEVPWFVDPRNGKGVGTMDGCNSCSTWSGADLFNWTFALVKHISFRSKGDGFPRDAVELRVAVENKEKGDGDSRLGTLGFYASSPDVQRYFCTRCSACVFYAWDNRPEMVDVAVGVLDSPDGARAESIISWSLGGEIGWREDMLGTWREGLALAVERESEEWRVRRGYPKSWKRVQKEGE